MATAARKVTAIRNVTTARGPNTAVDCTYTNAAAGDITQLSTAKVLLVVDADGTTPAAKQEILDLVYAAVEGLQRGWASSDRPSATATATSNFGIQRGGRGLS